MRNMFATHLNKLHRWLWPAALLVLTLFALLVRCYYVCTALVIHPVRGDAAQYVSYAWNLLTHHTFAKDLPGSALITPDNYRDPGYPFFLALLMKTFGTRDAWYASVLLCQALLGALTVTLTTQLGKFWLTGRWALTAGLLMTVWPHSISMTGVLLSETLSSFFCAAALLAFAVARRRHSYYWGFGSGVVLGAAALTNAVLLPFGILLAAFLAWRKLATRTLCAALTAGALLLPGCWAMRNCHLPPSTARSDSSRDRALRNFAQGASPDYHSAYRSSFFGNADQKENANITLKEIDAEYALLRESLPRGLGVLLQQFGKQPVRYASWYLLEKPYELWDWNIIIGQGDIYAYPAANSPFNTQRPWIAIEALCRALNPLLMLAAALGTLITFFSPKLTKMSALADDGLAPLITVSCLLAFVTFIYCVLQEEPRYSIPFRPFEILMALTVIAVARLKWHNRDRHACITG